MSQKIVSGVIYQNKFLTKDQKRDKNILREYIPDESVDLIYLDPPFNSSRTYNVLFKQESGQESEAQIAAFEDTWHWNMTAELTYQELEYKRQQELAGENVNAAKVLQQAQSNYFSAKAKEEGLRARLKLIGISAEAIQHDGIKSTINITTPIAGYVTEVNVNRGKFVNSADVMFKIVDTEHLHAEAQVFEKDVMKLRIGQPMKLMLANETEPRTATVYLIGKEISPERTVRVHGHLEKEDPLLIPGMYFAATIETDGHPVPVLPDAAVVRYEGVSYVFIQKSKNEFNWIEVETGASEGGYTHVIFPDDFNTDNQLVTQGAYSFLSLLKNTEE